MESQELAEDFTRLVQNPRECSGEDARAILETVCQRLRFFAGVLLRTSQDNKFWIEENHGIAFANPEHQDTLKRWLRKHPPKGGQTEVHEENLPKNFEASRVICVPLVEGQTPIGCFVFFQTVEERTWSPLAEHVTGIMTAWFVERLRADSDSGFSMLPSAESEAWPHTDMSDLLLSTTQQQLIIVDADGRVHSMNRAALKFEDLSPQVAYTLKLWELPSVAYLMGGEELIRRELRQVRQFRSVHTARVYQIMGGTRIFEVAIRQTNHALSPSPVFVLEAVETTEVMSNADITKKTQILVRTAFDKVSHFIGLLHPNGRILFGNQTALDFVGLSNDEIRGEPLWDLPWFYPSDRSRLQRAVGEAASGQQVEFEMVIHGRGQVMPIQFSIKPIHDDQGEIAYLLPEGHDLSSHKEGVRGRMAIDRLVERQNREKSLSSLAGGVAHNFNNLLTSILGTFELMKGSTLDTEDQALLGNGMEATRRAIRLSTHMLAFSGNGRMNKEWVNLSMFLESRLLPLRDAVDECTSLRIDAESNLPDVFLDPSQLHQVLFALLENADEATESSGGEIWLRTFLPNDEPGFVCLEVRDDGQGMEPKVVEHAFEPFFSTRMVGRGLGLAAAKGIATGHGGRIEIQSKHDFGTTVRVFLPHGSMVPPNEEGDKLTVLIIDDDPIARESTACLLEVLGCEVTTGIDGFEGVAITMRTCVDLVFLDAHTTDSDTPEILRQLATCKSPPRVVLMRELSDDEEDLYVTDLVTGFLTKPATPSALKSLLPPLSVPESD